jgi:NAD(P)-dependent dehydrogenase (short-subunit alcohol dehydrogenase family)
VKSDKKGLLVYEEPDVPSLAAASEFTGKVAAITGGTDGIGKHLALTLANMGCEVFVCGRRRELGECFQQEAGPRGHFVQTDLRQPEQLKAFIEAAGAFKGKRGAGRIDYLVNNAAVDPTIPIAQMTFEQLVMVLDIDLRACVLTCMYALPYLEKGEGKAIVNLGTTNYMKGNVSMTAYNAAKSGIVGFTRSLARELGYTSNIRANMVSPGWTMTPRQITDHYITPETVEGLVNSQSVREPIYPAHITPAVLFLLSQASRGISGQNIVVDGGNMMQ